MKTRRIVSSIALAAALTLGATGCGLSAPQGTTDPYAPSDGVDVDVAGVDVRNILLIADKSGTAFNVVFTGVNIGDVSEVLVITFVTEDGTETSVEYLIEPGSTKFGDPESALTPVVLPLKNVMVGSTIQAYFETATGGEVAQQVPVLDGTLAEYRPYVLSPSEVDRSEDLEGATTN